jgi:GAF domain-containing protein
MSESVSARSSEADTNAALAELNELLWALPSSLDPQEIVAVLLERCTRMFNAPLAAMWTRDGNTYTLAGCFGFTEKKAELLWQRLDLALRSGEPLQLDGQELHALGGFGKRRLGGVLAVPLVAPRGIIGWLVFARLDPAPFSDIERSFMAILANRIGGSLANARQYQETQARSAELELLNEMAALLVSTTRLDELLARVVERMAETLSLSWSLIYLAEEDGRIMQPRAVFHRDPEQAEAVLKFLWSRTLSTSQGRTAEIYRLGRPILIPNMLEESIVPADIRDCLGAGSMLMLPLASRGTFLGAMYLMRPARGVPLGADSLPLVTNLANQVSVAIANARLYENLEASVFERTNHLQEVYEQLAVRMVAGRDHFALVGEDLRKEMIALEASLAALEVKLSDTPPNVEAARASLASARDTLFRLTSVHERFFARMKEGESLGFPATNANG